NPWLPSGPGRHGLMQLGFGRDLELLQDGDRQHVFVGTGSCFNYCGEYSIKRVEPLTKAEWDTLPLPLKIAYVEMTIVKDPALAGENPTVQDVFARYEAGELRLPCVQLTCVAFDMAFYEDMVAENR
ncbi:hypothetical protein OH77DRAFT_1366187, partial [Trametes cingulata]